MTVVVTLHPTGGWSPEQVPSPVFKEGWRGLQLDARTQAPLAAAQQQFSSFEPAGKIVSVFPEGWRGYELDAFAKPFPVQNQQNTQAFEPLGSVSATFVDGWRGYEVDAFAKPFAAPQQQWSAFTPRGTIVSTFPEGWRGLQLDARVNPPLPSAQQQWASFQVEGKITSVFPDGWRGWQLDAPAPHFNKQLDQPSLIVPPLQITGAECSFDAIVISSSVTEDMIGSVPFKPSTVAFADGWRGYAVDIFAQPFAASKQQWATFGPEGPIVSKFPEGWRGLQLDAKVIPALSPAQQQWNAFQARGAITSIFPEGWRGTQLDARIANPLPAALQDFSRLIIPTLQSTSPRTAVRQAIVGGLLYPIYVNETGAGDVILAVPALINENAQTAALVWGWDAQFPGFPSRQFPVTAQQWASFSPRGTITSVFPDGWRGIQESRPLRFSTPTDQSPLILPPSVVYPEGWRGSYEFRFAAPTAPAQQQWAAFEPAGKIASVFADGWRGSYEFSFVQPFPPARQQWASFQVQGTITSRFPEGWRGWQLDARIVLPLPASKQDFTHHIVPTVVSQAVAHYGWFEDLSAARQAPLTPTGDTSPGWLGVPIVVPALPGSGKRYLPPTDYLPEPPWDERPRKPVRPIWDRPVPAPAPAAPAVRPAGPPPLPPLSVLGLPPAAPISTSNLPKFDHYVPDDVRDTARRLEEAREQADAIAALRALGLIPKE
jgi:hypothetical protein